MRAHGDFHLGRVWRAEQGWMVVELTPGEHPVNRPGGVPGDADLDADVGPGPTERSPLADVADMLWSFGQRRIGRGRTPRPGGHARTSVRWPTSGNGATGWRSWSATRRCPGSRSSSRRAREDVQRLAGLFELDRAAGRLARRKDDLRRDSWSTVPTMA